LKAPPDPADALGFFLGEAIGVIALQETSYVDPQNHEKPRIENSEFFRMKAWAKTAKNCESKSRIFPNESVVKNPAKVRMLSVGVGGI
jgi:hypothetical protein